jgi:hypothetical protein
MMGLKASLLVAFTTGALLGVASPASRSISTEAEPGHTLAPHVRQRQSDDEPKTRSTSWDEAAAIVDAANVIPPEGATEDDVIKMVQDIGFQLEEMWQEAPEETSGFIDESELPEPTEEKREIE